MISGSECRDVAAELRYAASHVHCGLSLQRQLAAITNAEDDSWRGVMRRLADLIDRPTCRNDYDETDGCCENGFKCSECGELVEDCDGYRITGTFNCCPRCFREVDK